MKVLAPRISIPMSSPLLLSSAVMFGVTSTLPASSSSDTIGSGIFSLFSLISDKRSVAVRQGRDKQPARRTWLGTGPAK